MLSGKFTPKIDIPSTPFLKLGVIPLAFIMNDWPEKILPSNSYILIEYSNLNYNIIYLLLVLI